MIPDLDPAQNRIGRLQVTEQLEIPLEHADGLDRGQVQDPGKKKDADGESDFPRQGRFGPPPYQGQCEGANGEDGYDDEGCAEIPGKLFSCKAGVFGGIEKLAAMLALYGGILDFFGTEGTGFHFRLI
jgi:hypothetical protein